MLVYKRNNQFVNNLGINKEHYFILICLAIYLFRWKGNPNATVSSRGSWGLIGFSNERNLREVTKIKKWYL